MKRKVIGIADNTLVVSLPSEWVREWGVKKGEELEVVESGSRLLVSTGEPRLLRKGVVDVSKSSERSLRWLLASLHKKGYDEIEIKSDNAAHSKVIEGLVRDLFLGFAVVHSSNGSFVVRSLSKELDDQIDVVVRRAFLVTLSLAEQCFDFVKSGKFSDLSGLVELEKQNNQLTNFVERILNKRGLPEPVKSSFLYVVVWNLEKVADEFKYLCELLSSRTSLDRSVVNLFGEVNLFLRGFYELFYKFDVSRLSVLSDEFKVLRGKIESALSSGVEPVVLAHLHHVVLKCADFSSSIFALND